MNTDNVNLAAVLFKQAELVQNEARDLRDQISRLYAAAGRLKALAISVAEKIGNETVKEPA